METTKKRAQHTPGPWNVVNGNEVHDRVMERDSDGAWIGDRPNGITTVEYPYGDTEGQSANARLIAAAPEMLVALKQCETALVDHSQYDNIDDLPSLERIGLDAAIAAIAKAQR